MAEKILEVKNLVINFRTDNGLVQAVRNISFDLFKGETLCIVGESGSGKSVTSKAIMGILANNAIVEGGQINYAGENLLEVSEDEFYRIRGHKIGMIFQDPLSSLNPIVRIGKQITEAMLINSNKLKTMYDNIISKELIAYKNTIAKYQINVNREKKNILTEVEALKVKLNSKETPVSERNEIKAKIALLNNELKTKLAELKAEYSKKIVGLKAALDEKKILAKKEVAIYKEKVVTEYKEKVASIKSDYLQRINGLDSTAKKAEAVKYKEKLAVAKQEYIDKTRISKAAAKKKALEIMEEVGIPLPEKRFRQYPFEFSGGMRQRIVIAIALTAAPEILICDEPTTALDVTIQAQILELIKKIQKERNLACIFITHDLGVVANMADRVAVMYAGKIVEYGKAEEIFFEPKHPYTWALLSSIPDVDSKERLDAIPGTPPNMIYPPKGDAFAARSKYAMQIDFEVEPPYFKVSDTHYAATWLLHPDAPQVEMPKIVSERIKNALKGKGGNDSE